MDVKFYQMDSIYHDTFGMSPFYHYQRMLADGIELIQANNLIRKNMNIVWESMQPKKESEFDWVPVGNLENFPFT